MTKNQTSFKKGNEYWKLRAKNIGRPSTYQPEFCEQIIAMGEAGYGVAEMACEFSVHRATLYDWAKCHADFSTAFARARESSEAYWVRYGNANLTNKQFQGNTYIKMMQARHRETWTERKEITGANGGPIATKADDGAIADAERLIAELAKRNVASPQKGGADSDTERSAPSEALQLADDSENEPTTAE